MAELLADVWLAEPSDLARAESGVLVTREGHCYDAERGELWFSGETAEAVLLQLDARRRALAHEAEELERRAEELPAEAPPVPLEPLVALAERLAAALAGAAEAIERFEAPFRARVDAGATKAGELAAELRRLGGEEADVRRVTAEAGERAGGIDVERARLEAEAGEARRRLEEAGAEPSEGDDREELAARIERLERRRETLGQVNPLAKEEYDREKERLTELAEQREDLEASLKELEELRTELAETVERRFDETFAAVSAHFEEVASTLFPGGHGRLRLTEPDDEAPEARARRRDRAAPGREARHAPVAALGRREGARSDLVPVRALPRPPVPVLPPGRGRGGAGRRQHRPLRRAPAQLLRPGPVHRRHPPEEDDGGRRYPLRRDHGRRRCLADRLAAPAA